MREKISLLWISLAGVTLALIIGTVSLFHRTCGFTAQEVIVKGRHRISKTDLLQAIQITHGDSIWKYPLLSIKKRVEEISWVHTAVIQRILPHTVVVTLVEKVPLAIWQHQGEKKLIDQEGHVIPAVSCTSFKELPVITGSDAPKQFASLYKQIQKHWKHSPVKGGSFLRSYRWNLYLANGQVIMLPEISHDYEAAFKRLEEIWPMVRNATTIDLRFLDATLFDPHL